MSGKAKKQENQQEQSSAIDALMKSVEDLDLNKGGEDDDEGDDDGGEAGDDEGDDDGGDDDVEKSLGELISGTADGLRKGGLTDDAGLEEALGQAADGLEVLADEIQKGFATQETVNEALATGLMKSLEALGSISETVNQLSTQLAQFGAKPLARKGAVAGQAPVETLKKSVGAAAEKTQANAYGLDEKVLGDKLSKGIRSGVLNDLGGMMLAPKFDREKTVAPAVYERIKDL